MKQYFAELNKVEEIKNHYQRLLVKHLGTPEVEDINSQYLDALKGCHGEVRVGDDNREHTYYFDEKLERSVITAILAALNCRRDHTPNVTVKLRGWYIWVEGATKEECIHWGKKGLRWRWHGGKSCWYWKPPTFRGRRSRGNTEMKDIDRRYGCREVTERDRPALEKQASS